MNIIKLSFLLALLCLCSACQTATNTNSTAQQSTVVANTEPVSKPKIKHSLGIIGSIEPIYILPIKSSFQARIDTGAETSSLDVDDYHIFERDGVKWVSFIITNNMTGEKQSFEVRQKRRISVKRINKNESRPIVMLNIKFGGKIIKAEFSLAKREKFEYQVLVGRNILNGRAIVDPSISNTLR